MEGSAADPLQSISIAEFGMRLRRRELTAESATVSYLALIAALEPRLGAFTHVAMDEALSAAQAMDRLLAAGVDLGPLMGVPVIVKDLFTVDGMPLPKVGSRIDVSDRVEPEGSFIRRLKRAGAVILGKTRMTEFAIGLVNLTHRTPWNPWDAQIQRMPGGSSSGSAVGLAAGLSAFSIGTDTGGSVRHPAAMCGLFGLKTTHGWWPIDGVFPLSTTFDSIGTFAHSARDAAHVFAVLSEQAVPQARSLNGLRLGKPTNHYFDGLSPEVRDSVENALDVMRGAGVEIIPVEVPETAEIDTITAAVLPAELVAHLGLARVLAAKDEFDPIIWSRIEPAFKCSASDYVRARTRQRVLCGIAQERMRGLDGWITPTTLDTPIPLADCATLEKAMAWIRRGTQNTRPVNLFGQCASSIPIPSIGGPFPVGLQVICAPNRDAALLSISQAIEEKIGRPARPDMSRFS